MELIGMLDSPYVRRVAITMRLLDIPFVHRPISVFGTFEAFSRINPVVKAPTLVCDDGQILMDSTLIIDHVESVAGRSLMPTDRMARQRALRIVGLALAACEKTVQIVYEHGLRPAEKIHEPWVQRVQLQLAAAYAALEAELSHSRSTLASDTIDQAEITSAIAWHFTQMMRPAAIDPRLHPMLASRSEAAEQLTAFKALPHG
ncbi:MAG: glutathione S-transferase [Pseudomonadota bacterium]